MATKPSATENARHAGIAYGALPEPNEQDEDNFLQPLVQQDHKQEKSRGLPKLQILAYAGIRSSERE